MSIAHRSRWKRPASDSTVLTCYELLSLALRTGLHDFTEGIYDGSSCLSYERAQQNQAIYLLNAAGCQAGSRLLDIGCGYGRLLRAAEARGATAVGITISDSQVQYCRRQGLQVQRLDYRQLPDRFTSEFDGVVANGSVEHFVQPHQAAAGLAEAIYRQFFEICHRVLDPRSSAGRLVTTVIHFGSVRVDPQRMVDRPSRFRRGTPEHHYWLLVRGFGGFYPVAGQLERCAEGRFVLQDQLDGTQDYYLTSEHWLAVLKRSIWTHPRVLGGLCLRLGRYPRQAATLLDCLVRSQSWNWQFRGGDPPMRLYRQTWKRI